MTRTYELGFIVEPRQSDDAVQEITQKYRDMIEASGAEITQVDYWGKRKLAYPIEKFTEGKYVFIFVSSKNGSPPFSEIERLMRQNDKVLRYLTVRTDLDLKRAARRGKPGTLGGPPKVKKDTEAEDLAAKPPAAESAPKPPAAESAPKPPAAESAPEPPAAEPVPEPPAAESAPEPPAAESAPEPPAAESAQEPSEEKTDA